MIKMKSKGECNTFEPQAWRRTICKNCFRTEPEHKATEASGDGQPQEDKTKLKDNKKDLKPKGKDSLSTKDKDSPSSKKTDAKPKFGAAAAAAAEAKSDSKEPATGDNKKGAKSKSGTTSPKEEEEDMDKKPGAPKREPGKLLNRFGDRFDKFNKPADPPPGRPAWARPQLRSVTDRRDSLKKKDEVEQPAAAPKKDKPVGAAAAKKEKEAEEKLKKEEVKKSDLEKDKKAKAEPKEESVATKDKPLKDKLKVIREKDVKETKDSEKDTKEDKPKERITSIKPKDKSKDKDEKDKSKVKEEKEKSKVKEEKDKSKVKEEKDKSKLEKEEKEEKPKKKDKDKDKDKEEKKEKKKKKKLEKDSSVSDESSEETSLKKKAESSKVKEGRRSAPFEKPKEERESGKQDKDKNTAADVEATFVLPQQPAEETKAETKIAEGSKEEQAQPSISEAASIATPIATSLATEKTLNQAVTEEVPAEVVEQSVAEESSADFTLQLNTGPQPSSNDPESVQSEITLNNDITNDVSNAVTNDVTASIAVDDSFTLQPSDAASTKIDNEVAEDESTSFTMTLPSSGEASQDISFRGDASSTEGPLETTIVLNEPERQDSTQRQDSMQERQDSMVELEPDQPEPPTIEQSQESPQVQHDLIRVRDAETVELEKQQEIEKQQEAEREQQILAQQQEEFLNQKEKHQPEQELNQTPDANQSPQVISYESQPNAEEEVKAEPRYHQSVVLNVNGVHVITDEEETPVAPPPRVDSEYENLSASTNDLLAQVSSSEVHTSPTAESGDGGVRQFHLLRQRTRHRPRVHSGEWERRTSMDESELPSREEAMMEGTRMLIENLREKIMLLEEKIDRLDREKAALGDLLAIRKAEFNESEIGLTEKIDGLQDHCKRIESENTRLLNRIKLPESERNSIRDQENEICDLRKNIEDLENTIGDMHNENNHLKQEIGDLHVEMEELHDQFRDEESLEFRELQKELEATAKNCRILQFKLRKVERKNEQLENERITYEERFRQLENRPRSGGTGEISQVRELEEELRMAKEVSVRLHDELEMLEERRIKTEEELDRTQDYLRESESRRSALQSECDGLIGEVEALRSNKPGDTLDVPKRPMLGKMGSQGSTEFDMEQVMRDLSDSLERENDLKEQLKFTEEETKTLRKKVSEIEDENDALNIQINKMTSTGKTGKYAKHRLDRKSAERKSESSDDEDSGELRLQLEIMDNEMKVMRKKMNELETENENLLEEIKYLQGKLSKPAKMDPEDDDRPIEERITGLTQHIGELKMKLLQQDYQVEPLSPEVAKKAILKKSRSLDESSLELTKQLDITQRDTQALRDRVLQLKTANENLLAENRRLTGSKSPSSGLVPLITTDDSALKNVELQDKIRGLQKENSDLKEQVAHLDERVVRLSREVTGSLSDSFNNNDLREARDRLQSVESEANKLRSKLTSTEADNERLKKDLERLKANEVSNASPTKPLGDFDMDGADTSELKNRILDVDSELRHLKEVVRSRDEEISRLEEESQGYQDDVDKIMDTFRQRELEWKSDMDALQNKNNIISSLLDLMQERASATTRDTLTSDDTATPKVSERSCISTLSDTDTGSDDVFTRENSGDFSRPDVVRRDWDEQFLKRIECLERLLQEERKKNEMNDKKSDVQDGAASSLTDDAKLYQRQIELLQKELSLAQQQLREANDVITDLKSRFTKVEEARTETSKQFNDVAKQLEDERKKRLDVEKTLEEEREESKRKGGETPEVDGARRLSGGSDKPPASWRWEKQDLEKQVKELTKRAEDLDKQLKRKMVRSGSITEDDKQKDDKSKEKLDALTSENEKLKEKSTETEKRFQEMIESNTVRESQWASDREIMEAEKSAAQKEVQRQLEVIRMKDEIISGKEDILRQKEQAIVERDDAIKQKDELIARREQALAEREELFKTKEDQFGRSEDLILTKDHQILELETKIKFMDETVRQRDDRLSEKDFALEKLNRLLSDKESEAKDLDQSIRIVMEKLKGKDAEMSEIKKLADDLSEEKRAFEERNRDLNEAKLKVERDRDKETAALVIQREKLENQLEYIMREKKCADDEIRLLRHTLNERDEDWGKTKQRYETELGKKQEKIHSLEVLQSSRDSDVIQTVVSEKQSLLKDKQRLEDIVKKLRTELEKSRNSHVGEVNNIKRTYTEYKKKLETRTRDCIKLQKEIARLREQLAKRGADHTEMTGIMSPIAPFSPTVMSPTIQSPGTMSPTSFSTPSVRPADLSGALERQELIFKAEKVGMEEIYEQKLRLITNQLTYAKSEIETLKQENGTQKELLLGGSKTLSEVKSKYDIERNQWNEEKNVLERGKVKELESQKKIEELESAMDKLRIKLKHEEADKTQLQGNLEIKNKEVELLRKMKQTEGSSVDQMSALNETKVLVEEAEKRMKEVEQSREREQREIFVKLEQLRADWNRDKKDMADKNAKLVDKAKQLAPLQKTLIDMQYKLHSYRETWLRERSELQRQLEEAQRTQLEEKQKYVDLLSETKQVKPKPSPVIQRSQSSMDDYRVSDVGAATKAAALEAAAQARHKTTHGIVLARQMSSPGPTAAPPSAGSMDPSHTSKSLQNQSIQEVQLRSEKKTSAPPAFRRSLSTSEAEVQMALNQQMMKAKVEQSQKELNLPSHSYSGDSASPVRPPRHSQVSSGLPPKAPQQPQRPGEDDDRSRNKYKGPPRRSYSTNQDNASTSTGYDTASLERPGRSTHSNRNSMYSSGTQSAYTSRDSSPEKGRPRFGKSPYPAPPPSFLITPPRSPRHFNPSPHCSILTSENMMKLYEKLGNIERADDDDTGMSVTQSAAIAKERTGAVRVLMKSMSVDNYAEEVSPRDKQGSLPERTSFIEIIRNSDTYEDAPLSQTLPASIRVGELVITPGIEALSRALPPNIYQSKMMVSPRSQRRKFFDDYPADAEAFAIAELERVAKAQQKELERSSRSKAKSRPSGPKIRDKSTDSVTSVTSIDSVTRRERSISEKASAFFSAVKDKRKKFGSKRAGSVEDSSLGGHIARAGMTAVRPAAPTSPEPPTPLDLPNQSSKDKRRFFHRRAASIDLTTLFRSRESSRDRSSNRK